MAANLEEREGGDVDPKSSPSGEERRLAEETRKKLDVVERGLETFIQEHHELVAHRKGVLDLEDRASAARKKADEFRAAPIEVMLRGKNAASDLHRLEQRLSEQNQRVRQLELEIEALQSKRPLLFGRSRHRLGIDAARNTLADAASAAERAKEELDHACRDAHTKHSSELESAAEEAASAVKTAKMAEGPLLERAHAEFRELVANEPTLRERWRLAEAKDAARKAEAEKRASSVSEMSMYLGLAFAGLTASALALAKEECEKSEPTLGDAAEKVAISGVAALIADSQLADLRRIWLDLCPALMNDCLIVFAALTVAWVPDRGPIPNVDSAAIISPLLKLIGTDGFIASAATSPDFFFALKDLFGFELIRSKEDRWLRATVASLLCGELWAKENDHSIRFGEAAKEVVELLTQSSVARNPALQRLMIDARKMAESCFTGRGGIS